MKNVSTKNALLTLLIILVIGVLMSCNDDNVIPINSTDQVISETPIYRINLTDMASSIEVVSLDDISTGQKFTGNQRNPNQHANGDFVLDEFLPISFSAMVNKGGIHGEVEIGLFFGGLLAETECLLIEGNHAVVGARITDIGDPDLSFLIGFYLYFQVIDNGEGSNAPEDLWYSTVFIEEFLDCQQMCPGCVDYEEFGPPGPISSGNIQVN